METNSLAKAASAAPVAQAGATKATAAKAPPPPAVYVKQLVEKQKEAIKQALPGVMTPERFSRICATAVSSNPKLMEAVVRSPMTFLGGMMTLAQLGLEANTPLGQAYLIPFNNSKNIGGKWVKVPEVSVQLGYKGLIDLAYRSGEVTIIQAHVVREGDLFEYEYGLDPKFKHVPAKSGRGKTIYYYAMFKTKSGASNFEVWSYEDMLTHAKKFSKSYNRKDNTFSGPWESDFDSMAKKTVVKAVLKYAPMKSDFARAIVADNSVRSTITDLADMQVEQGNDADAIDADFHEVASEEGGEGQTAQAE